MKLQAICPLCGMWVHPDRFESVRWPIKLFGKVMGGRYPHSKRGIVKHLPMEVPAVVTEQIIARLREMADHLGYDLVPSSYHQDREIEIENAVDFRGVRYVETVKSDFEFAGKLE